MATYSSILAWKIPWPEEPGRLQSMGSKKKKEKKKNTLNNYLQLQVIGNTHNLPDRRKVLLLTGKQWVKNGTAQCTKEAN